MIDLTADNDSSSSNSEVEVTETLTTHQPITLSPEVFNYIKDDDILHYLERKYGVKLFIQNNHLYVDQNTIPFASHIFEDYMVTLGISGFDELKANITKRKNEKIHIFIDHSNICSRYRFDARRLLDALIDLRDVRRLVLVGSTANSNDNKFDTWRDCGCDVTLIGRDPHTHKEIGVDDVLHGLILCESAKMYNETHTIIILTGDGNINNNQCSSFPVVVEEILKKNTDKILWKVELWTWKDQASHVYRKFQQEYNLFSLLYLDEVVQHESTRDNLWSDHVGFQNQSHYESNYEYIGTRNSKRYDSSHRKHKKVKKSSKKRSKGHHYSDYGNSTAVIKNILNAGPSRPSPSIRANSDVKKEKKNEVKKK